MTPTTLSMHFSLYQRMPIMVTVSLNGLEIEMEVDTEHHCQLSVKPLITTCGQPEMHQQ